MDITEAENLVASFVEKGISGLLNEDFIRKPCIDELTKWCGQVPGSPLIAQGLYKLAQTTLCSATGLVSEAAKARFIRAVARVKLLRKLLEWLVTLADAKDSQTELRAFLQERLNNICPEVAEEARIRSAEDINILLTQRRLDGMDATLQDIRTAVQEAYSDLLEALLAQTEPPLDDKSSARESAQQLVTKGSQIYSLNYAAEIDTLTGRQEALDTLVHFVIDHAGRHPRNRFRWWLMVAAGGEGKSRLALALVRKMQDYGWRAGFLPREELGSFEPGKWIPREPTLLVIDYPAEAGDHIANLIRNLARRAESGFDYPVRLLLLERQAAGQWFEKLTPNDSDGVNMIAARWQEAYALPPLRQQDLLALMRARLPDNAYPDDRLWDDLCLVDGRRDDADAPSPRALFAIATAMFIANDAGTVVSREGVFDWLIKRERQSYWHPEKNRHEDTVNTHENLLALATAVLGVDRAAVKPKPGAKDLPCRDMLPRFDRGSTPRLEDGRYARMSGRPCAEAFASLQPDLLGEYFTLRLVEGLEESDRCALIASAARLSEERMAEFAARCFRDFPALFVSQKVDALFPCNPNDGGGEPARACQSSGENQLLRRQRRHPRPSRGTGQTARPRLADSNHRCGDLGSFGFDSGEQGRGPGPA